MNVILLEKIRGLGDLGEQVKVRPGYGRNYLVPQGKALPATAANVEVFEARKAELIKRAEESVSAARMRAEAAAKLELSISARASEEGKLYGSVTPAEVQAAAQEQGVELATAEIYLPAGTIRQTGEFEVELTFHSDVQITLPLKVEAIAAAA